MENSESERYAELSRRYIEKADEYLLAEDRVQASEKGWGAVAEAIKSIAEQRGWNHQGHRLLNDVAFQLSEEWARPDVRILFDAMEKLHINFYEDNMGLDAIAASVGDAKTLLRELETLRQRPPHPPASNATAGVKNRRIGMTRKHRGGLDDRPSSFSRHRDPSRLQRYIPVLFEGQVLALGLQHISDSHLLLTSRVSI